MLFILDASNSMVNRWESGRKIDVSKRMIHKIVDSLAQFPEVQVALRVYGHQSPVSPQDCNDTRLEIPFGPNNQEQLKKFLDQVQARGTTPLATSLAAAAGDFPDDDCRRVVILLTDGIEACDCDPCQVSLDLQRQGIILEPFVVGIGLDKGFRKTFECVGRFYDAESEARFVEILRVIVTQALNSTSAQVNLLDSHGLPTGTDVAMTFYDAATGAARYNYMHTLNHRGNPDTLYLDPTTTYRLKVHSLPPVYKDSVKLLEGRHNVVALDAPMGDLQLNAPRGLITEPIKALVRDRNTGAAVHTQQLGTRTRYLTGDYTLEILTTPPISIDSVNVRQNHTTTIDIPKPGIANFVSNSEGQGGIYLQGDDGMTLVVPFPDNITYYTATLQPGKYIAIYRPIGRQETMATLKRPFEITPGAAVRVLLY